MAGRPGVNRVGAAWAAAYVVASFLSHPHPLAGGVLDLGPLMGWIGPACLVLAVRGLRPAAAARRAALVGWLAHGAIFHWIFVVTVVYGHAPAAVGVVAPLTLALYPALFAAGFGAVAARLGDGGVAPAFLAACAWAALDHARSFVFTGFPWALLGYAQHGNPALLPLAAWTGVYGLSFVTALGGIAAARIGVALRAGRPAPREAVAALAVVLGLHVVGVLAPGADDGAPDDRVRVAVLQGNIEQGVKWSPDWAERTLGIYTELTRAAAHEGAEVVVWPETAVPGSPDADAELAARLARLARETGVRLVVGAVGVELRAGEPFYYDSAFLWDPQGAPIGRYDKAHLVPFGEYVPFRALLGHFLAAVARGAAALDVSPGAGPRALAVGDRLIAGVPICYELLFPDLVRRFVDDGAGLLLAITNDAWYGRTGAPHQFLAITAMRSAETRVWTARAANTGVSAIIDDRGRVRKRTEIFERDFLVADVPRRPPPRGGSFYTRHGDVFAWSCWAVAALGIARGPGRQRPPQAPEGRAQ